MDFHVYAKLKEVLQQNYTAWSFSSDALSIYFYVQSYYLLLTRQDQTLHVAILQPILPVNTNGLTGVIFLKF